MKSRLVIGSRNSKLALAQAESVASKLREVNPGLEVSISRIVTSGDRNPRTRLDQMAGVGVFVKELETALLAGDIDLAVHSLKDVPTQIPDGLSLLAVTERLDPRDVLVSRGLKLQELSPGSKIGTGSLRRSAQLAQCRPDLDVVSIRGNVDTRLRRVASGEVDGVILAAAAMSRLGWEDRITEYLALEYFLPAAGQGALVIEGRTGDDEVGGLVSPLNHLPTWRSVAAERAFLSALGGGCRAPIAALGMVSGNLLKLDGMVADVSGKKVLRASEIGNALLPEEVGARLAHKMAGMGAARFVAAGRLG